MARRTVTSPLATGAYAPQMMKSWGKLFGLTSDEEPEEILNGLQGTAQSENLDQIPQQFQDIRQNQAINPDEEFLKNLRAISQLPIEESEPGRYQHNRGASEVMPTLGNPKFSNTEQEPPGVNGPSAADIMPMLAKLKLSNFEKDDPGAEGPSPRDIMPMLARSQMAEQEREMPGAKGPSAMDVRPMLKNESPMDFLDNPAFSDYERGEEGAEDGERNARDLLPMLAPLRMMNEERGEETAGLPESQGLPRNNKGQLKDPLEYIRSQIEANPELRNSLPEETLAMLESNQPDAEKPFKEEAAKPGRAERIVPPEQPITEADIESYPEKGAQPGAVEQASQDPQVMADLERLNGLKKIDPQDLDEAKNWQKVLTEKQEALNEEEKAMLQKAESGDLTMMDKFAIGLAIAIPILLALRYGSDVGLVAAGSGMQGFAGANMKQQKLAGEKSIADTKRKGEIQDQRLDLANKNLDMNKKFAESIPDKAAREFLNNKDIRPVGNKVGIFMGDERDALALDAKQLETSDEGIKTAKEYVKDAKDTVGLLNKSNLVIDELTDILEAMPQDSGLWNVIKSNWGWFSSVGGKNPFGGEPLMIDVQGKDGKVRKVNAFEMLKQKTTALQDIYNKVNLSRANLTDAVLTHWDSILGDPKKLDQWLTGQSMQTVIDKTQSLKDFLNAGATEVMVGHGFLREPLEKAYPGNQLKPMKPAESVVDQIRANPQAFKNKVK